MSSPNERPNERPDEIGDERPGSVPWVEFYAGLRETISGVSLRRNSATGVNSIRLLFEKLRAIERFNSFSGRFSNALCLTDSEGRIEIVPTGVKFVFGGPEGDELERVECTLEVDREDHWQRLMRFMHRYAEANGMTYGEKS
jgi:photosystem II Psb28-2 protein